MIPDGMLEGVVPGQFFHRKLQLGFAIWRFHLITDGEGSQTRIAVALHKKEWSTWVKCAKEFVQKICKVQMACVGNWRLRENIFGSN